MLDWQRGLGKAGAADGSANTSKLLVHTTSRSSSGMGLSIGISGQFDTDSVCSGGSPHRGAGRGHRNEPFFIGVAGGTASGETTCALLQQAAGAPPPLGALQECLPGSCCSAGSPAELLSWMETFACRQDDGLRPDHAAAAWCAGLPAPPCHCRIAGLDPGCFQLADLDAGTAQTN